MGNITYKDASPSSKDRGRVIVSLEGKRIGDIRFIWPDGFRYHQKGGPPGESFRTIAEVKESLELP